MTEAEITASLLERLRDSWKTAVVFKHDDNLTFGIPDMSVSGHGITSWWEIKVARDGKIDDNPQQNFTCKRLFAVVPCFYIIFEEPRHAIYICTPEAASHYGTSAFRAAVRIEGWRYEYIVNVIRTLHTDNGLRTLVGPTLE